MPPRPTRRGRGVSRYPVRSSVHNITNLAQWNRLHRRAKKQLIFVLYTVDYVRNSHRLKTTLVELSSHSEFADVIFAIVDIEKAKEVAEQEGVEDAPTFMCYQSNNVIEKLERVSGDSAPSSLWQMLHRNAVRVRTDSHRAIPDTNRNNHWRAIGKVLAFFAFSIGAILTVYFMKPISPPEAPREPKIRRDRSRSRSGSRSNSHSRSRHRDSDESEED